MAEPISGPGAEEPPGFMHSLKTALAVLSSIFHTRLELFATELEEERERIRLSLLLMLLAFFGFSLGLILLTVFVVAFFWEKGWIAAIGCLSVVYLGVGLCAAVKLRSSILRRPRLFPATLAELGKDRDRLRGSSRE